MKQGCISHEGEQHMAKPGSIASFSAVALCVWSLISASLAAAEEKRPMRIIGAGLLSGWVQSRSEMYMKTAPSCSITVAGATSGTGFQNLIDGHAEIAMVTRTIIAEEEEKARQRGLSLESRHIGKIELAIITNVKNTVDELTMDQLASIFKGEITNWSRVGGPNETIEVTMRPVPQTGSGMLFQEVVLKGAPYAEDRLIMNSYNTTVAACSVSFAIGYIPTTTTYFDRIRERGAKVLRIRKDADSAPYPLRGGVLKETAYPIAITFWMYWNAKSDHPCIDGFINFLEKQAR